MTSPQDASSRPVARVDSAVAEQSQQLACEGLSIVTQMQERFSALEQWHTAAAAEIADARAAIQQQREDLRHQQAMAGELRRQAQEDREEALALKEKLGRDRASFEKYKQAEEESLAYRKQRTEEHLAEMKHQCEHELMELRKQSAMSIADDRELADRTMSMQREQHEQDIRRSYADLESTKQSLTEAQATVADERASLTKLRVKLDEEWDSVSQLRKATESLMHAWDHEHERITGRRLRLISPADDDTPTLEQAA
jgi:chromosome segregation ATPase